MKDISFVSLLPSLVEVSVGLGLLWLIFWLGTRAPQRWITNRGAGDTRTASSSSPKA